MGEATTALQHFHGIFLSRRRQSTSVNGVCQALTPTSCILRAPGGIKDHNSPILLVENAANPHHSRARTLPGDWRGRAALSPGPHLGKRFTCHKWKLRARSAPHKARNQCTFGGSVWELWRITPRPSKLHRKLCNLVNSNPLFRSDEHWVVLARSKCSSTSRTGRRWTQEIPPRLPHRQRPLNRGRSSSPK